MSVDSTPSARSEHDTSVGDTATMSVPVSRWLPITTLALSVAGLGASAYLTVTHYTTGISLACPEGTTINCEKVTTSPQSEFLGIPVAVLGLAYFAFMVAFNLPAAWGSRRREVHVLRVAATVVGVGFVFYLIYAELFVIDAICLWCSTVHALTLLLFVVISFGSATRPVEAPSY